MKIKCYNKNLNGTWIIDTVREFRKAIRSGTKYKNIKEYNVAVLKDVKSRINEGIISKFEIIKSI